ncbi:MAG TPA: cysteine--tRNA ligase [Nitrososphaeraceae archaeon]|nr:cysteine--tRNA ligase [Nitrososphaeraceae archaeon]
MKLYNTLSRTIEEVNNAAIVDKETKSKQDNNIGVYLCGLTVYDDSHIGHARTIIFFDVLRRYLIFKGYKVKFIQNFTDVDDKIINRAKSERIKADEIAAKYTDRYFRDFDSLNVLRADLYPRATENIEEMINLIEGLMKKGHAYLSLNGVYFRVKSFPGYGKLSKRSIEELESGYRIEVDKSKEDPLDFALWKFYSDPPVWNSPWGKGRPGWHIECSAMALKYLGCPFEIHGGGHDLLFPHHENEIAQSEAFSGKRFAKIWLHTGMVTINSEKMSKSLGNIVTIQQALNRWGMNTLRIYCMSVQYSKPLDYTNNLLSESRQKWRQIETLAYELRFAAGSKKEEEGGELEAVTKLSDESMTEFESAIEDNMNTTLAMSIFMKFVAELNRYAAADKLTQSMARIALRFFGNFIDILGLKVIEASDEEKKEIEELIVERNKLRAEKKFQSSDDIRKRLIEKYSVELMDHKDRTIWKKVENLSTN